MITREIKSILHRFQKISSLYQLIYFLKKNYELLSSPWRRRLRLRRRPVKFCVQVHFSQKVSMLLHSNLVHLLTIMRGLGRQSQIILACILTELCALFILRKLKILVKFCVQVHFFPKVSKLLLSYLQHLLTIVRGLCRKSKVTLTGILTELCALFILRKLKIWLSFVFRSTFFLKYQSHCFHTCNTY